MTWWHISLGIVAAVVGLGFLAFLANVLDVLEELAWRRRNK